MVSTNCALCGLLLTVICIVTPSLSEVVPFEPCKVRSNEKNVIACAVENVVINPCPEVNSEKPCKLKYGTNASINFDFTAEFDAERANSRAYWDKTLIDLPFIGMNTDACEFTKCPIKSNVKQTYSYSLPISDKYPKGEYLVKWRLWKEDRSKECCFKVRINIQP